MLLALRGYENLHGIRRMFLELSVYPLVDGFPGLTEFALVSVLEDFNYSSATTFTILS